MTHAHLKQPTPKRRKAAQVVHKQLEMAMEKGQPLKRKVKRAAKRLGY